MKIEKTFEPYHTRESKSPSLHLGDWKYKFFASRETCIARDELYFTWLVDHGAKTFISIPNQRVYDYYFHERTGMQTITRLGVRMEKKWREHLRRYEPIKSQSIALANRLSRAAWSKNHQSILRTHRQFVRTAYNFAEFIYGPWAVIWLYEDPVIAELPDDMEVIGSIDQPIEWQNLKRDVFKFSPTQMVAKYAWMNIYSPYDKPYTPVDFQKIRKETDRAELKEQFRNFPKVRNEFAKLLTSIKDPRLRRKAEMVHMYAWLKTDRIDTWKKVMYGVTGFYRYLATLIPGATLHDATNISIAEATTVLKTGVAPSHLRKRSEGRALYYFHDKTVEVVTNASVIRNALSFFQADASRSTTLTGMVACKGKVCGPAKIISHSSDVKKIKDGDIFIAKYTFPSFTPFMLKSAAIVTDEGGITSHAAVISREYNKPCVVDTKSATKVFKDGDTVEVDAEKGVVRRI